jgi:SseB protein N-terminal domain
MKLFKKLFGANDSKIKLTKSDAPRNVKLVTYLNRFGTSQTVENYHLVLDALNSLESFLIVPSVNEENETTQWRKLEPGAKLKLLSVVEINGLTTLLAFSDEEALAEWSKGGMAYKAIIAKDLMDFCTEQGIYRIVINIHQRNMFSVEREVPVTTEKINVPTKIKIGTLADPLPNELIGDLINSFYSIPVIEEAFQYGQTKEGVTSHMIAFRLSDPSESAKKGVLACMYEALQKNNQNKRIGIYFIETEEAYRSIMGIKNALFYSK